MPVEIKICGLMTPDAVDVALEAGADYGRLRVLSAVAAPSRLRGGARARRARARTGQKVALSVDADDDWLAASIEALKPDMLQLHGRETPERVAAVRSPFGLPVMKALPIASAPTCRRSGSTPRSPTG